MKKFHQVYHIKTIVNCIIINLIILSILIIFTVFFLNFTVFLIVLIFFCLINLFTVLNNLNTIIIDDNCLIIKNIFTSKKLSMDLIKEVKKARSYDLKLLQPLELDFNFFGKKGIYKSKNHELIYAYSYSDLFEDNVIIFYGSIIYLISIKESDILVKTINDIINFKSD